MQAETPEDAGQPPASEEPAAEPIPATEQPDQSQSGTVEAESDSPDEDGMAPTDVGRSEEQEPGEAGEQSTGDQASPASDQQAGMADGSEGEGVSGAITDGDQMSETAAAADQAGDGMAAGGGQALVAEPATTGEAAVETSTSLAGTVDQEPDAGESGDGESDPGSVATSMADAGQPAEGTMVAVTPPTFDVVRVDRFGTTTIAGRAPARSLVQAIVNDEVASSQRVGSHGQFAMIFSVDTELDTLEIRLRAELDDGTDAMSEDTLYVMVPRSEIGIADATTTAASGLSELEISTEIGSIDQPDPDLLQPSVFLATSEGTRMIQSPVAGGESQLLVDMISYDEEGEVVISGSASSGGSHVLIYLDNELVKSRKIAEDGTWWTGLSEVKPGRYTLRVDEIDEDGSAVARVEMPFQKEPAEMAQKLLQLAVRSAEESDARISKPPPIRLLAVQRGFTLWGISREHYGLGRLYVNIFTANKDQIKDPDLIYPGQIFVIPDESTVVDPLW